MMRSKLTWTTVAATLIWGVVFAVIVWGGLTVDDIDIWREQGDGRRS
jgi:predicted secreted protein